MSTRSPQRMKALGYILSDGLNYSWFDVLELDSEAVTATIRVNTGDYDADDEEVWKTVKVTADDVSRGLNMYREYMEGKREGYPGEWKWDTQNALRAGLIQDESEFVPTIHARAKSDSYGWQMVAFDKTNGLDGDYDANTADSVMQFALIGHNIFG